jgi:hypothetical protein
MLLTLHPEARMGQDTRAPVNPLRLDASRGIGGTKDGGSHETLVVVGHRDRASGGWMGGPVPPSSVVALARR